MDPKNISIEAIVGCVAVLIAAGILYLLNIAWAKMNKDIDDETKRILGKEDEHEGI